MAAISSRTFVSDGVKKCLSISNGEYKRGLSIGNNWTKLRIGMLVAQNPNGTSNLTSGTRFILGMCSGQTYGFGGGANTVNAVGVNFTGRSFSSNNWNFTYIMTGVGACYEGSGGTGFYTKVGAIITDFGGDAGARVVVPATTGSLQRRYALYVQVEKGSPNYTVYSVTTPVSIAASSDYSVSDFESGLQAATLPVTINGYTLDVVSASVTASEVAGVFDTVNFYTNFTEATEIYEVGAYKVA